MDYIECVPAYGRDYSSQYQVANAWNEGKDFLIVSVEHPEGCHDDAEVQGPDPSHAHQGEVT